MQKSLEKTVRFIERELLSKDGAFYTSLDADSGGGRSFW